MRDAPVLIICLARPELLDGRPGWGGGKLNATSILLEPLTQEESDELMGDVSTGARLPPAARARIAATAAGNPLFLEQMLAMLAESDNVGAEVAVPPAIQALLAARLDRLEPDERRVLACASIEGEIFHVGGLADLFAAETREAVASLLMSLVRKELIRPEPPDLTGGEAFSFRHALIRDAAYEGLSKETRSELHAQYADWLEQAAGERADEYEEFLGYHLERAFRYRAELDGVDDEALRLADRARRWLAAAGRSAFRRGDPRAAINLLERARALATSDERASLELAADLGVALLHAGEMEQADFVLNDAIERAGAVGQRETELHASLVRDEVRMFRHPELIEVADALRRTQESLATFQAASDDIALARAWLCIWVLNQWQGNPAIQQEAAEQAREHARRAGSRLDEARSLAFLGRPLLDGPKPAALGAEILENLLHELSGDLLGGAIVEAYMAPLLAMQGRFDDARQLIARSQVVMHELGMGSVHTSMVDRLGATTERLAGKPAMTERMIRVAVERSADIADSWFYALCSMDLARAVCEQGRFAECLAILEESERRPSPPDFEIVVNRPITRALALARLGQLEDAEILASEALGHAAATDFLGWHAEALLVLAEIMRLSGRPAEATDALKKAVGLFERKGNAVSATRAGALLDELG